MWPVVQKQESTTPLKVLNHNVHNSGSIGLQVKLLLKGVAHAFRSVFIYFSQCNVQILT